MLPNQNQNLMRGFLLTTWVLAGLGAAPSVAFEGKPKFGPEAVPITQQTEYLRTAPAPDYWKLSPFYVPQQTSSACALASVVMALNALRGLPARSDQRLVTQSILLKKMSRAKWTKQVAEGGSGVTFDGLVALVTKSLARFQWRDDDVEVIRPADAQPETLARLRQILSDNEVSDRDVILVYFNQGVGDKTRRVPWRRATRERTARFPGLENDPCEALFAIPPISRWIIASRAQTSVGGIG